jgi:hypothetical protein
MLHGTRVAILDLQSVAARSSSSTSSPSGGRGLGGGEAMLHGSSF